MWIQRKVWKGGSVLECCDRDTVIGCWVSLIRHRVDMYVTYFHGNE